MPRREKKKYYFLYKTTNLLNGKFYIGVHSTDNLNDGYLGSGKILRYSIKKYGIENFKIEKLEFFEDKEKLYEREKEIVNDNLLKNPLCMNLGLGGKGGILNELHSKKFHSAGGKKVFQLLSKKHSERLKIDPEYRKRYSSIMKDSSNPGFSNKTHSSASKEQMRKSHQGKHNGEKNSQYGKIWVTNGIKNKMIKKEEISEGWKPGRI